MVWTGGLVSGLNGENGGTRGEYHRLSDKRRARAVAAPRTTLSPSFSSPPPPSFHPLLNAALSRDNPETDSTFLFFLFSLPLSFSIIEDASNSSSEQFFEAESRYRVCPPHSSFDRTMAVSRFPYRIYVYACTVNSFEKLQVGWLELERGSH